MRLTTPTDDNPEGDFLHEIGSRMAAADPLHEVLEKVVEFIVAILKCDSCFVYVCEDNQLVLRASKNPHPEVVDQFKIAIGEGITGWVAEHREAVAVPRNAWEDPRFKPYRDLPEDRFEAFLSVPILSRGHLVGVISVQHRLPHTYTRRQIRLISTLGFLVGAEIEAARLESGVLQLSPQLLLETRKMLGISVVYLSDMERGNRQPFTSDRVIKIAAFLKVDPADLLQAADQERGFIDYAITNASPLEAHVVGGLVAGLARGGISDDKLHRIQTILEGREYE